MFAPLKPKKKVVDQVIICEYEAASAQNWSCLQEDNYTAYYLEEDYSDFVEVLKEKLGYSK